MVSTMTEEKKDNLRALAHSVLEHNFDVEGPITPYIEIIEGDKAAPYVFILNAWLSRTDYYEFPDEPNFSVKGSNGDVENSG